MNQNVLVWLDLETSSLNPDVGKIFEIAVIVTDWQLNELDRGSWVIGYSKDQLPTMEPFVERMHKKNGLLDVMASKALEQPNPQDSQDIVEYQICRFLVKHVSESGRFIIAGNSIAFDRSWIKKHLLLLDQLLHHRTIDVTPFGLLIERWCPDRYSQARGEFGSKGTGTAHRALDDIEKSIRWMRAYKRLVFDAVNDASSLTEIVKTSDQDDGSLPSHPAPPLPSTVMFSTETQEVPRPSRHFGTETKVRTYDNNSTADIISDMSASREPVVSRRHKRAETQQTSFLSRARGPPLETSGERSDTDPVGDVILFGAGLKHSFRTDYA